MFSTAPAGAYPLVPTRDIGRPHQSPVYEACGQKTNLRTPGGGLPEELRPTRRPVWQRSGLAATEEWRPGDDGRYKATKGTDPETATSGLHRSWWTLLHARSGNRLHSVHPCRTPRARPGASSITLARSPIGEELCTSRTFTSLRAVRVTATPCSTGWLGRPVAHTSQTDSFL